MGWARAPPKTLIKGWFIARGVMEKMGKKLKDQEYMREGRLEDRLPKQDAKKEESRLGKVRQLREISSGEEGDGPSQ